MEIKINIDGSITFGDQIKQLDEPELQELKMNVWSSFNDLIDSKKSSEKTEN